MQETIHSNAAVAAFVMLIVAMLLFSVACFGDERWWALRWVSLGFAGTAAGAAVATQLSADTGYSGDRPADPGRRRHGLDGHGDRQRPPARVRCVVKAVLGSRWFQGALSLLVVVAIFGFFFPKVADYGAVWDTIAAMTPIELATLGLVAAWNLFSYWPMLTAVQPGLRLREAAVANLASTAVANTVPGGGALGVGVTMTMQRSWGIPGLPDGAGAGRVRRLEQLHQARPARRGAGAARRPGPSRTGPDHGRRSSVSSCSGPRSACSRSCCGASRPRPPSGGSPAGSPRRSPGRSGGVR